MSDSQFDLPHYLDVVRRRRVLLVLTPLVCMVGAFVFAFFEDSVYRATAQVRIESEQIDTEVELVDAPDVVDRASEELGDAANQIDSVSAARVGETQLVGISVTASTAQAATDGANAWADAFRTVRNADVTESLREERDILLEDNDEISSQIVDLRNRVGVLTPALESLPEDSAERAGILSELATLQNDIARLEAQQRDVNDRITAIDSEIFTLSRTIQSAKPASFPGSPFSPKPLRAAATGLFAGLVLAIFATAAAEIIDDPIWDATDAQRWIGSIPVLASVPPVPEDGEDGVPITVSDPAHPVSEAFRVLRTSLQYLALEQPMPKIMVTSADVGDGKTTTSVNLAVAMARGGSDVVIVDGDLRRSAVHERLGMRNTHGVTSVLLGDTALQDTLRVIGGIPGGAIEALTAGPMPPNPSELVSSEAMRTLLDRLVGICDQVVIDSPPLLAVSDSLAMAKHVDGILLVVRLRRTSGRTLARAVEQIDRSGVRVLGVVLNDDREHRNAYLGEETRTGLGRVLRAPTTPPPPTASRRIGPRPGPAPKRLTGDGRAPGDEHPPARRP